MRFAWAALVLALLTVVSGARAKPKVNAATDASVGDASSKVLVEEYAAGDFAGASKKVGESLALCDKKGCRPETVARLHVLLGMIASQMGNAIEAKDQFASALKISPGAQLPERGQTPGIKIQWGDVKGKQGAPPSDPPRSVDPPPSAAAVGVLPDGWKNADAFRLAMEATEAKEQSDYKACVEKDLASLALEDQPRTRLHLSSCQYRSGKLKDALRESQKALDMGIARKDSALMRVARERVKQLVELMPRVTFQAPTGVSDLEVTFDKQPVPANALTKKFSVDPGPHAVTAKGVVEGDAVEFVSTVEVAEKDLKVVVIKLTRPGSLVTEEQLLCQQRAKTQEEVQACLPQKRRALVVHLGTDLSAYGDTNSVFVVSPGINASVGSPTSGWHIGGNALIDVVSAASPDIISYASPPFREKRYAGGLNGAYKLGAITAQASGSVSSEPDYISRTIGGALLAELRDKNVIPRVGLNYTWDLIGRGPFSLCADQSVDDQGRNPCKRPFTILAPEVGVTLVLSPESLLMVGTTVQFESGDQSKPYRHVPMFDKANVDPAQCAATATKKNTCVKAGQDIATVDQARLALRPAEQLPTSRQRYALAGRYIRRIGTTMTLRIEERVYYDTWSIMGSTTDGRYLIDFGRHLRVWPHGRLHMQSAANFYELAYVSTTNPETQAPIVPTYRTTDRELQSMVTVTGGAGARIALGNPDGDIRPGISFSTDVMYSYYFQSLFLRGRTGVYGTLGLDVEF